MRIAYLINNYPAISHSFIRREILGLEALGAEILRVTIRPPAANFPDADDRAERSRTVSILAQGATALLSSTVASLIRRPVGTLAAFAAALRMAGSQPRRLIRHVAYFVEACWLVRYMVRQRAEHIHAHFGTNPAAVARLAHLISGLPYSFTVHGPDEFDDPGGYDLKHKIADAQAVIAISSYGRSQLMRWSDPSDWQKIAVVRCGLDDRFLEAPLTPPANAPRLCCVARLSGQKGLPLLIDACSLLKARKVPFSLAIVGDGELRGYLEAQVARLGLASDVRLTGSLDAEGVRGELLDARAFVLASFAEGLPVVLMEALALGRPVIATRIAGIPELVDERCGWLVPAGDAGALAGAMAEALAASVSKAGEMGAIGRERVREMHSARTNAGRLLDIFRQGAREPACR